MIKIDEKTDAILERIAASESEEPDVKLIREIVEDQEAFELFLTERGLQGDDAADSVLTAMDDNKQRMVVARNKQRIHAARISRAAIAKIVDKVVRKGFKRGEVVLWVERLSKPTGRSSSLGRSNPKLKEAILLELDALRGRTEQKDEESITATKKGRTS